MSRALRLAVMGDSHLTAERFWPGPAAGAAAHDRGKYIANLEHTIRPMLADIREAEPDWVLHAGDLTEGAPGQSGLDEMAWALATVRDGVGAPLLVVRGNHDRYDAYQQVVGPHHRAVAGLAGGDLATLDLPAARLVLAETQRFGEAMAAELAAMLGDGGPWKMVLAHSPAFNVGRPFFRDTAFAETLLATAATRRVDALLCGHTHNSSVVSYDTGGQPLLQVMLSSVAWLHHQVPLAAVKSWLVPAARQRYAWRGLLENSRPAVWGLLELTDEMLRLELRSVGGGLLLAIELDHEGRVTETVAPAPLRAPSGGTVTGAWLCVSLLPGTAGRHRLVDATGRPVAELPSVLPWYHHRTALPKPWPAAGESLELRVETVEPGALALASAVIEVEYADGGRSYGTPSPLILDTTGRYGAWSEPGLVTGSTTAELPPLRLVSP